MDRSVAGRIGLLRSRGASGGTLRLNVEDWMSLEIDHFDLPLSEDNLIRCPPGLRKQVRRRSIYDAQTLEDPAALHNLRRAVEEGDQAPAP